MKTTLPTFLPGRFILTPGCRDDYAELARFHYIPKKPATFAAVWVIRYSEKWISLPRIASRAAHRRHSRGLAGGGIFSRDRVIAIGVLSYPFPFCTARDRTFQLFDMSYGERLRFANRNIRTISRVIVHPQFRSLGLAVRLVDCLCKHCPTRYVEAAAAMGRVHPFFEKAGMTRHDAEEGGAIYFLMDRGRSKPE